MFDRKFANSRIILVAFIMLLITSCTQTLDSGQSQDSVNEKNSESVLTLQTNGIETVVSSDKNISRWLNQVTDEEPPVPGKWTPFPYQDGPVSLTFDSCEILDTMGLILYEKGLDNSGIPKEGTYVDICGTADGQAKCTGETWGNNEQVIDSKIINNVKKSTEYFAITTICLSQQNSGSISYVYLLHF